jgi:phosphoenolpyruvate-protein phosphotransferase (PTS system enzyme I)
MLRGLGVSDGIAIAKAKVKEEKEIKIVQQKVSDIDAEIDRLTNAVYRYTEQLEKTYKKTLNVMGEEEASIYKQQLNIMKDSVVIGGVKKQIRDKEVNAESVLDEVKRKYDAIFNKMDDDFLKRKAEYIKNITDGIIKQLVDTDTAPFSNITEPVILVAEDLEPSDIVEYEREFIKGIILETSNKTCHGATLAKSWKIPCIIGVKKVLSLVKEDDLIILEGNKGEASINPNEEALGFYNDKLSQDKEMGMVYHTFINQKTITKDHYELDLNAIVSTPDEVKLAIKHGADHIGLYRTEGLFVGKEEAPSEEIQLMVYKEAVQNANKKEICFRTFDCNGKSSLPYVHLPTENNPALGFFSTRIALANREIFVTQLKAILRASAYGNVRFVVPMVSSIDELLDIRLTLEDVKLILEEEGHKFNRDIKYGVILETPSVAIITSFFAQELDFLYVDIDDMLQYVTGTDPTNEMVFELYDEYHPGFLRLLKQMIRSAHREGTSICFSGKLCNNEYLLPLFVAMGVDRLCVPYKEIPKSRWETNSTYKKTWEVISDQIQNIPSSKQIKGILEKNYGEEYLWKLKPTEDLSLLDK